jgi:hypothetical protein
MFVLGIPLLSDLTICMQPTLEGLWVRDSFLPRKGLAFSLFFLVHVSYVCFDLSLAFPFCLPYDGSTHGSFIGVFFLFCVCMCTLLYGGFLCEEGRLLHMSTISHIASSFCKVMHLWTGHSWHWGLPLTVVMSSEPLFWECPVPRALSTVNTDYM